MKATARRSAPNTYLHRVEIRGHELTVDEEPEYGGTDAGPDPQELLAASLASCTAITIEMYANRKQWDIGLVEVEVEYEAAERGSPTNFNLVLRLPDGLSDEQVQRLREIAARCPVHRTLAGEVTFDERTELAPRT
jgi:putative redox protein